MKYYIDTRLANSCYIIGRGDHVLRRAKPRVEIPASKSSNSCRVKRVFIPFSDGDKI